MSKGNTTKSIIQATPSKVKHVSGYTTEEEFFAQEFVSPHAWEKVLKGDGNRKGFPQLKLCLAHFGGVAESWGKRKSEMRHNWPKKLVEMVSMYENFYVDISYFPFSKFNIRDEFLETLNMAEKIRTKVKGKYKLEDKILFGTDWYMTASEYAFAKPETTYKSYFEEFYKAIISIDKELLAKFMVLNPMKFFRIDRGVKQLDQVFRIIIDKKKIEFALTDIVDNIYRKSDIDDFYA